ncbi:hypothetical protein B0H14DRAFT_2647349 [Mycena olivaceomarginata]|nr:hypothetical protein B0H14DRAFT_2647349 [Mycena olivaceomarginata]
MRLVKKLHGCPASEMHSCALLLSACGQQNMGVHEVVGDVWGQTDVRRPPTHNVSLRFSGIGRCGSTDRKPGTLGEDPRVTPPEWQQSKMTVQRIFEWPRIWGYSSTAVPTIIHDNGVILLDRWVIYQVLSKLLDDSLTGSVFIGEKATCGSGIWNLLVKNDLIASQIRNTI